MKLDWSPQFSGTTRLATPAIDLTGVTSVVFSFKHALDNYQGSNTIGIATSSDGGTTWNDAWTQAYNTSASWAVTQTISTTDMNHDNVKFCIYFTGSSYNINDWYFDDIEVFTMENLDLSLNSIDINNTLGAGNTNLAFTVQNKGNETINNFKMSYQVDNEPAVEEVFTASLASLASSQFSFAEPITFIPGSYSITVSILEVNGVNDDEPDNNTLTKNVGVALGSTQKIPMIEHFSSSTCGPCVSVNTTMLNFTNSHPGMFTYTKYQMNWPGNGDPYYTAEGGTRRNFYGVQAVPQCFLDGEDQGYAAVQTSVFNDHYAIPAFADVRGSFNVDGDIVTIKVDFMSYYDMTSAKAFVSINEKETHNNVGSNGETSFHHIFMKFATAAAGNALNIPAGECQHFEFTQNMSGTHVEEMSDLEVSAWIQDMTTHEVLNSHFLFEYTDIHPYPVQNLLVVSDEGTLTATWSAPEGGNALSYNVYVNGELAENVTALEYSAPVSAEFNVVQVEAVYDNDMTSVKMAKAASGPTPVTCDPVSDLTAEYGEMDGYHGAIVRWTEPEGVISYNAYVGETLIASFEDEGLFIAFDGMGAGTYTIGIVAVYADCESVMATIDFEWNGPTSVDETAIVTSIYPNPTTGNFTVESSDMAKVEVYNLVGQKVYETEGKTVTINASSWNKGIYLINIFDQNGSVKTQKLMVK